MRPTNSWVNENSSQYLIYLVILSDSQLRYQCSMQDKSPDVGFKGYFSGILKSLKSIPFRKPSGPQSNGVLFSVRTANSETFTEQFSKTTNSTF